MPSDALPDDLDTLKAMLLAERYESERLRQIIKELQRHRFGRRAETLPEEQMLLGLEDVEQVEASTEARKNTSAPDVRATRAHKRRVMCGRRQHCKKNLTFGLRSGASHVSGLFARHHDRWP